MGLYPSKGKATKMIRHDKARGKRLTTKQRSLFQSLKHGWKPTRNPFQGV